MFNPRIDSFFVLKVQRFGRIDMNPASYNLFSGPGFGRLGIEPTKHVEVAIEHREATSTCFVGSIPRRPNPGPLKRSYDAGSMSIRPKRWTLRTKTLSIRGLNITQRIRKESKHYASDWPIWAGL